MLALGAMPSETLATDASVKVSGRVLRDTARGATVPIVINLRAQADLSRAYSMKNQNARGWYVYRTLKKEAARTQAPLKAMLASRDVPYRSFWVANVIFATADRSVVNALAARSDVRSIESNDKANWLKSVDRLRPHEGGRLAGHDRARHQRRVHAPAVWALGFTGQGIVIANQDTGMRWTHNAIKPHYRGWNGSTADHNYNWHDSIHSGGGICGAEPHGRPATTTLTARTRPAPPPATTAPATRSASHRAPSGSAAATWTRATARPRPTPSASSSSSRRPT